MSVALDRVIAVLRVHRFRCATEAELQGAIASVLAAAGVAHAREVVLAPRERIDFLCDPHEGEALGLEVKVDGAANAIVRQLQRYAASPLVQQLALVTTRRAHASIDGTWLNGKKVKVVLLLGGVF